MKFQDEEPLTFDQLLNDHEDIRSKKSRQAVVDHVNALLGEIDGLKLEKAALVRELKHFENAVVGDDRPQEKQCGVCGGVLVSIRGRYPHTERRDVCPTCLAERMDTIREITDPSYGAAYRVISADDLKQIQPGIDKANKGDR